MDITYHNYLYEKEKQSSWPYPGGKHIQIILSFLWKLQLKPAVYEMEQRGWGLGDLRSIENNRGGEMMSLVADLVDFPCQDPKILTSSVPPPTPFQLLVCWNRKGTL